MELTSAHLEAIKEAARAVEYGSVTINISASARTLDLVVENRVKIEKTPEARGADNKTIRTENRRGIAGSFRSMAAPEGLVKT